MVVYVLCVELVFFCFLKVEETFRKLNEIEAICELRITPVLACTSEASVLDL